VVNDEIELLDGRGRRDLPALEAPGLVERGGVGERATQDLLIGGSARRAVVGELAVLRLVLADEPVLAEIEAESGAASVTR
jgi:hypothetical protein